MNIQTIHITLTNEAAARCQAQPADSLRVWLLKEYERFGAVFSQPATLFSTAIEVAEDVPLLLTALSQLTERPAEELIETWALQLAPDVTASNATSEAPVAAAPAITMSAERVGQVAEILDWGETLFEQTIADARQRLGGDYPDSEPAEAAMEQIFHALRALLELVPAKSATVHK